MHDIGMWLSHAPALLVYATVALLIGLESMGIPLPGEATLISAALLAAAGVVDPFAVAAAGITGAVVGDSLGYYIGRRGGRSLLARLGRRFPKHFGPEKIGTAEQVFAHSAVWAVFFGRSSSWCCGSSPDRSPAPSGCRTNASSRPTCGRRVVWAGGMTALMYGLGSAARIWLDHYSWVIFVGALGLGMLITGIAGMVARRRLMAAAPEPESPRELASAGQAR
ncbi:DedA family protein [Fodinicola feengrottensis]|uniref:DedA family protein n=1 Tax=Fodinicola feengrottensis TaxID=435914 RepID=UPI0024413996|nr:DedA family protein [Fodinicola feengrottensis]